MSTLITQGCRVQLLGEDAPASSNVPLLVMDESSLSVVTGESLSCSASGGLPSYAFSDSGTGYLSASTRTYSAPLGIAPFTDVITVQDAAGQVATATVRVRAFETKDSYREDATSKTPSQAASVAEDSLGYLYSVGNANDATFSGSQHWAVRRSTDNGITWALVDDFTLAAGVDALANDVVVDASDRIFVVGQAFQGASVSRWVVRRSLDHGVTWSTVDTYVHSGGANAFASAVAFDSGGNVYVVGSSAVTSAGPIYYRWIVRKSSDNGATWVDVDEYVRVVGQLAEANDIVAYGGNLFVVGRGDFSAGNSHWIVRRSSDQGASWSTVDDYQQVAGRSAVGKSILVESGEGIIVAGSSLDASAGTWWNMRRSLDNGATWNSPYIFKAEPGKNSAPQGLCGTGPIYSAGYFYDALDQRNGLVMKSTDGGTTWMGVRTVSGDAFLNCTVRSGGTDVLSTGVRSYPSPAGDVWRVDRSQNAGVSWSGLDEFSLASGRPAVALKGMKNSSGHLFVIGQAKGVGDGSLRGVLRKSVDGGANWTTASFLPTGLRVAAGFIDASDVIWAAGLTTNLRWRTLKSIDGGTSWNVADDFQYAASLTYPSGGALDVTGALYVVGMGMDGGSTGHWLVRRSADGGASWSTVDDYAFSTESNGAAAIAGDTSGILYVGGSRTEDSGGGPWHRVWVVRKGTPGGAAWSDVDSFELSADKASEVTDVAVSPSGAVFVLGSATDASDIRHLIVRKSDDGGASWSTVLDFNLASGKDSEGRAITLDASGNAFVVGTARDAAGAEHGVALLSRNQGVTWTRIDDVSSPAAGSSARFDGVMPCLASQICAFGAAAPNGSQAASWIIRVLSP